MFAVATHGLFMGDANRILGDSALDLIVVADSVPPFRLEKNTAHEKVVLLPAAPLFAEAIRNAHAG